MVEENQTSERIIGAAIEVHREFGPGLLESVYEESLCREFELRGMPYVRQQRVPIEYKGASLATPLRLDLLVEDKVIVDTKAKDSLTPIDKQQLLTYLKLCNKHLGLLINFNNLRLIDGIVRIANNLPQS